MPDERYSPEETAQRGDEIYDRDVRPHMQPEDFGKVVAIDIETGAHAIGENAVAASKQVLAQRPEAQIWLVRVGHRALHRIGPQTKRNRE
jgi:hypothetical protein